MSKIRFLTVSLACVALIPAGLVAQDARPSRLTIGGGLGFQDDSRVTRRGMQVEAAYVVPLVGRRLEGRLEGGVHRFPESLTGIVCAGVSGCPTTNAAMTVLRAGASIILVEQTSERGAFYWIAGFGAYRVTDPTSGDPYTRLGWNAGFGVRGRSVFAEIRYHEASGNQGWRHLTPITFGVRF